MYQRLLTILFVGSLAFAGAANAATITYTASGTGTDGALAGSAVFTTSAGQISVTLTNTLAVNSFVGVGQAISDLSFTLSNPVGTLGAVTASGQQGTITGTTVAYTTGSPGRFVGVGGGTFSASGSTVLLEAVGGSQPTELISPFVANGGTYPNGNNGLQAHNDYTIGSATFVINLSGITAATTVSSATFSFGTAPDTFVPGTPSTPPAVTPEPSSLMLLGTGVLGAAGLVRRRYSSLA